KSGTGFVLTATGASLTADSNTFNITGVASLSFNTVAGAAKTAALGTQPVRSEERREGTTETTSSANVTIKVKANTPQTATGAALAGALTVAASVGVVPLCGLSIYKSGTGFVLTATGASLTADSNTFNITGVASLSFNTVAGAAKTAALGTQPV